MLRRMIHALKPIALPEDAPGVGDAGGQASQDREARRGFFKKAAVGAVALSGTAGMAKVVVDSVPRPDLKELYDKERMQGDKVLAEHEYVLMSDQEKEEMIDTLVDSYHKQG